MPQLIAQGRAASHRWRRPVPDRGTFMLGRSTGRWSVAWDEHVSRTHAELSWRDGVLSVKKVDSAQNPIFYRGRALSSFELSPNEHFVIGQTTFTLVNDEITVSLDSPSPRREQSFSADYLRGLRFRNAEDRINLLSKLPELISGAASDWELSSRLVNLLLAGIPRASAAAIVVADEPCGTVPIRILHWDRRGTQEIEFRPSDRLIRESVRRNESIVHVWEHRESSAAPYTALEQSDWAFCIPLSGTTNRGWCLYVSGGFHSDAPQGTPTDPEDLRDDVKFAELAAATFGALREVGVLQRRQSGLSQFFSPRVLEAIADHDPVRALAPREAVVTVLFCDLRGFSRRTEQSSDRLLDLLERVSRALGVTTHHVLEQGGVIGDFHGDAVMGFWGWPLPQEDGIARAARAALAIRRDFATLASKKDDPLADFRMGIGIATGQAVAGKIGTVDQVKVTAFGPAVNLAARLEGMTKKLRAPILLDEATASAGRRQLGPHEARFRRLAVVRPAGLESAILVTELLPPVAENPELTDAHIQCYELALERWSAGDWNESIRLLHEVPSTDLAKDFLTVYIAQHQRTPPRDWDGAIQITDK